MQREKRNKSKNGEVRMKYVGGWEGGVGLGELQGFSILLAL